MNLDAKSPKKSRRPLIVGIALLLGVVMLPFALLAVHQSPFFYNRHFNRIRALLEEMPDARVVDSWRHEDLTLEDFGFTLQVRQCPRIRLDFYEGGDWYRDFEAIDGILFSKPYNLLTKGYEVTALSCDELSRVGISVRNLTDVVSRLEAVLAYLKDRPSNLAPTPRKAENYVRIYYDLDAYKPTQR
jgi:hypothetical protein